MTPEAHKRPRARRKPQGTVPQARAVSLAADAVRAAAEAVAACSLVIQRAAEDEREARKGRGGF